MQRINTAPLSGFMELLPEDQMEFDRIKEVIRNAHLRNGFLPIDTPLIYREEVLLAKAGGETEKQIYRMDKGDNKLALRFDHTVPLAAYVAENQSNLQFPFKVSQIGKNYRGERSQKGRYREFYQCDVDVIGRGELDISYDAEVIGVLYDIYKELKFGEFTIRVSNRKLLNGFLSGIGLGDNAVAVARIIDDAEKISPEEFEDKLAGLGIDRDVIDMVGRFIRISGGTNEIFARLREFGIENEMFRTGLDELSKVMNIVEMKGMSDSVKLDLMIVRGLDYYTGTVYETVLNDCLEVGSIGSGGRYDDLTSNYSNEQFRGVGISIGLTRLFCALKEAGIVGTTKKSSVDLLILPFSENQFAFCYDLAKKIRESGKNVDVLLQDMKIGKKLAYANKVGVENVIVVGEEEVLTGRVKVKNMMSGDLAELDEWS
jgi:histidyl-tRNA synthetase